MTTAGRHYQQQRDNNKSRDTLTTAEKHYNSRETLTTAEILPIKSCPGTWRELVKYDEQHQNSNDPAM